MPHISSKKIDIVHLKKLQRELVRSFERSFVNLKTEAVFNEFFTKTERIMFAKRLAVIAMLKKGVSSYMICETLSMSPSTTSRMSNNYEKGKYANIVKEMIGKKDIWKILDNILLLNGVMPPKYSGGRWRNVDKIIYKAKLKKS